MTLTRRQALMTLGFGTLTCGSGAKLVGAAASRLAIAQKDAAQPAAGPVSLPPLPYPAAALEPHIDTQTMEMHHGRHHQAYVTDLNDALQKNPDLAKKPLAELVANYQNLPENVRTVIRNNGGGHLNHVQFWTLMAPNAGGPPTGAIADAINGAFGSFDKFKEQFNQAAITRFGSGWAWLSDEKGKLVVHSTANQDHPSMEGRRAIFGLDVWEHAYYLKYQNRRPDYVNAWWNVVNWAEVNKRLKA
jgi:superoxide dismutase, Fe-Mn family